jgi:hypothetical protein
MADQVVGLQYTDPRGANRGFSFSGTEALNTYNFVLGRKKANAQWMTTNRVDGRRGVVTIDSELAETYHRLRERNRLVLPRPVASLLASLSEQY